MSKTDQRLRLRLRRKKRIRKKITGTAERPRMSVFRSPRHIYVQVIDDVAGRTLASVSSFKKGEAKRAGVETCADLGKQLADRCKAQNISQVVFDKNGFDYHGRLKALADGARSGGLKF